MINMVCFPSALSGKPGATNITFIFQCLYINSITHFKRDFKPTYHVLDTHLLTTSATFVYGIS